MHQDGYHHTEKGPHQHICQEMLPQVDPGITYGDGSKQVEDICFLILLEDSQHGSESKYGGRMTGGKTAKAPARYPIDKIRIFLPMLKYFPGAAHREYILKYLGQKRREQEGGEYLPGL